MPSIWEEAQEEMGIQTTPTGLHPGLMEILYPEGETGELPAADVTEPPPDPVVEYEDQEDTTAADAEDVAGQQWSLIQSMWQVWLTDMGYTFDVDDEGAITNIQAGPDDPYETLLQEEELKRLGFKYEVDAEGNYVLDEAGQKNIIELTGDELEALVGPATTQAIEERRGTLTEQLSRKGITEGSTAWAQAWARQGEAEVRLKASERMGELGAYETLLGGWATRQAMPQTPIAGMGGGLMSYNPYMGPAQLELGREQIAAGLTSQKWQASAAETAGQYQMWGTMFGGLLAGAMMKSSKDVKKDIKLIDEDIMLEKIKDSDIYEYRYKGEPSTAKKHIGLLADYAPEEIVTEDRKAIIIPDQIGLLTSSVKALAKKVENLEDRGK